MPDTSESLSVSAQPGTEPEVKPKGYWDLVALQFRKNKIALFSLYAIGLLFLIAAWAPMVANGKPFIWRQNGKTEYPLFQYMVAPTADMSVDYFFNYLCFATITLPLALLVRSQLVKLPGKRSLSPWLFCAAAAVLAFLPFVGRHWREDRLHYPQMVSTLDKARGDYALFTIVGQDPISVEVERQLKRPDRENWLGTDKDGRDVLARMLHGARISLSVGFVSETIAVLLGIFFGALAGFYRGWMDIGISRFIEVVICFPTFFLILVIVAYFENRSIFLIMVVIGATGWPGVARLVRGEFLRLAEQDFVQAARALGSSSWRVMFKHMLPNAMGPVLVSAAFGVAGAILTESALSYLGFGAPPPTPTWGEMISQGKENLDEAWWLIVYPGVSIFLTVTIYNLAGDGLRDAMDPKMRK